MTKYWKLKFLLLKNLKTFNAKDNTITEKEEKIEI